ncbi:copper resistance protein CopC [Streptomyces sp. H39-S7]|uniref:copper resistance protein CopC n=1 Tax=Streptomyces sp. H39-S7 TaxID=3004357 RepID=UPI0022AFA978|nr:copper resistance protein CopC [Streptomyces sp. H39-S7]MCZ4122474.1 copper resistance protein CopC [Streptomyces sp. H39-S7]
MTIRRALVVLGALLAVVLGAATPASAHAALVNTNPGEDAIVKTAPQQVVLTFSEGVLLSADSLRVLDPAGGRVDSGPPQHANGNSSTAAVALRAGLGDGTYTVAWKAVSDDSHPVAGAFTFSVGAPSKTTVDVAEQAQAVGGGPAGVLYGIGRYVAYAGFALLVGASAFLAVCWPRGALLRPMRRIAVGGWVALVASTIALLMLRGPYVNGGGLGDALDLGVMRDVLNTRPGAALLSRLLLLAAAAVFLAVLFGLYAKRGTPASESERAERADLAWGLGIGGGVIATGIAATWAMAEHASVGIQSGLAMPVDVAHLLSMAVWLGGLTALLTALVAGLGIEREAVQRFSKIGFAAVATLVATGTYQSWRQLGSWDAFVSTSYGQLLLVKIGLVVLLVELAWLSRRWTARLGAPAVSATAAVKRPERVVAGSSADPARQAQLRLQRTARDKAQARKTRESDPERDGLRKSVLAEVAVAVVVLAVTTLLTGTQPGRAAQEKTGSVAAPVDAPSGLPLSVRIPYDTHGPKGKGQALITIDPGRVGQNEVHVLISGADPVPVDVPEVKLEFTLKAKSIGPLPVALQHLDVGHWTAASVQLPMAGTWQVSVTVRTSDIDQVTETRNVEITS